MTATVCGFIDYSHEYGKKPKPTFDMFYEMLQCKADMNIRLPPALDYTLTQGIVSRI